MYAAPMIQVQGLTKSYGSSTVLDHIDLNVPANSIHGYIGPNGVGKTTTVKILAGLIERDSGEVQVAGFDPRESPLEVKQRIGYLPESAVLYESLTIAEFLLFIGRLHRLEDAPIRARADAFLEAFDLTSRLGSRLITLSKGMRQKVLLTAAVLHRPSVLFVDEPLSGLDVSSATLIKEFFRLYADGGRAVLYCSHVLDVVERVCDSISILHQGKIVAEGSFEELSERMQESSLEEIFGQLTNSGEELERARKLAAALAQEIEDNGE